MRLIITLLLSLTIAMPVLANNVIPTQYELRQDQIDWLDKHRTDENYGVHQQFAWFRTETGQIFSVSINEYRKSGHNSVSKFMNENIEKRINAEVENMKTELAKALNLMDALALTDMPIQTAIAITTSIFDRVTFGPNGPQVTSKVIKDLVITL